jgi:hypothetical protein
MKKRSIFLIIVLFTLFMGSCKYSFIVPIADDVPTDTVPDSIPGEGVSFSKQIQPIFDYKCITCHKSGSTKPYLTTDVSYNQVVPAHVNSTKPEESDIYKYPAPANSSLHTWKKYNSSEANLVLTWIKEGAKNN